MSLLRLLRSWLAGPAAGKCAWCDAPAAPRSSLCEQHRIENAAI